MVGRLIGEKGSVIQWLRGTSHCGIDLCAAVKNCPYRIVTIKGHPSSLVSILSWIASNVFNSERQSTITLLIHNLVLGSIMGQHGSTIREIRNQSKATIHVSEDPLPASMEKTVLIHGDPGSVQLALEQIFLMLKTSSSFSDSRHRRANYNLYVPHDHETKKAVNLHKKVAADEKRSFVMWVNKKDVGAIIGKKGMWIESIRQRSGTHISIPDDNDDQLKRIVRMLDCCSLALAYLSYPTFSHCSYRTSRQSESGSNVNSGTNSHQLEIQ